MADDFDKAYEAAMAKKSKPADDFDVAYEAAMAKRQNREDPKDIPVPRSKPESEKPSFASSAGRGLAQGATLKFGDEAAGLIQALGNKLTGYHDNEANPPSFWEDFKAERDAERGQNARAKEAHPVGYIGGEITGGVPLAIASLGRSTGALKASNVIASGAGLGGIGAMGASEAELGGPPNEDQMGKDVVTGTAVGGLASILGLGLGKAASAAGRRVGDAGRGIKEALGLKPAVNLDRAAETLGAEIGKPATDPVLTDALESGAVDKLPPSTFNAASENAPNALSTIASRPDVRAAEDAAKAGVRSGIASTKESLKNLPEQLDISPELRDAAERGDEWAVKYLAEKTGANAARSTSEATLNADLKLLQDMAARKLPPSNGLSALMSNFGSRLGPVGRGLQDALEGNSANLARALANPDRARELALLLAAGRQPNLAPDAVKALSARALSLLANPD